MKSKPGNDFPVFESEAMRAVISAAKQLAPSELPVFLAGEPGTGKEMIADLVHSLSSRNQGPLIKINCEALPPALIEPELFGGATGSHVWPVPADGLFRQAERGTLFLDEVTAMPRGTQSRLLRVIRERRYSPLGGGSSYPTDFRIIAATNRLVASAMNQGTLREDLYYRIGMVTLSLPPLRERREDIMPLAKAALKLYSAQLGKVITGFTTAAAAFLEKASWPGNVRQLQSQIHEAVARCANSTLDISDFSSANLPGERPDRN
jgi:transcriptional regulator with PAS, ATPase and Fis domain